MPNLTPMVIPDKVKRDMEQDRLEREFDRRRPRDRPREAEEPAENADAYEARLRAQHGGKGHDPMHDVASGTEAASILAKIVKIVTHSPAAAATSKVLQPAAATAAGVNGLTSHDKLDELDPDQRQRIGEHLHTRPDNFDELPPEEQQRIEERSKQEPTPAELKAALRGMSEYGDTALGNTAREGVAAATTAASLPASAPVALAVAAANGAADVANRVMSPSHDHGAPTPAPHADDHGAAAPADEKQSLDKRIGRSLNGERLEALDELDHMGNTIARTTGIGATPGLDTMNQAELNYLIKHADLNRPDVKRRVLELMGQNDAGPGAKLGAVAGRAADAVGDTASSALDTVVDGASSAAGAVGDVASSVVGTVAAGASSAASSVRDAVVGGVGWVGNKLGRGQKTRVDVAEPSQDEGPRVEIVDEGAEVDAETVGDEATPVPSSAEAPALRTENIPQTATPKPEELVEKPLVATPGDLTRPLLAPAAVSPEAVTAQTPDETRTPVEADAVRRQIAAVAQKPIRSVKEVRELQKKAATCGIALEELPQASTPEEILLKGEAPEPFTHMTTEELALYKNTLNKNQQSTLTEPEKKEKKVGADAEYDINGKKRDAATPEELQALLKANVILFNQLRASDATVTKIIPEADVQHYLSGKFRGVRGDFGHASNFEGMTAEQKATFTGLDWYKEKDGGRTPGPYIDVGPDGKTTLKPDVKQQIYSIDMPVTDDGIRKAARVQMGPDLYQVALAEADRLQKMRDAGQEVEIPALLQLDENGELLHAERRVRKHKEDPSTGFGYSAPMGIRGPDGEQPFTPNQEMTMAPTDTPDGSEMSTTDSRGVRKVVARYDGKAQKWIPVSEEQEKPRAEAEAKVNALEEKVA